MKATPRISLQDIKKSFGSKKVLDGVNLTIQPGESLVIIGGSGTGKSVTLKCILGLLIADSGVIKIDGENITNYSARRRKPILERVGMLFQGAALFDSLPVWRNVSFGLMQGKGLKPTEARRVALEKLSRVGLDEAVADLKPAELSGGMQKRVGLARAIASDPDIIFFDEPTTGLDPIMADVINDLIVECVKDLGATTLTITHDMASARKIGHNIALLHQGKIIWHGPVAEVDTTDNPYVEQFVNGRKEGPIKMALKAF